MALPALTANSSLPAPATKSRMVNFQSLAVVKAKNNPQRHELPAQVREIANERLLFCREVYALIQAGSSQPAAVDAAKANADMFPHLVTGGKHGQSALTIYSYRSWMKRLGKSRGGVPDWGNIGALSNRYCLNVRGAKGAPEFWRAFNAFYLNENKLSLDKSYTMATDLCRKNGISDIPTPRQVRHWMNTHADQAAVMVARNGTGWAEDHLMGYIRRDWSAVTPNECWVGDHHELDAPVRVWDEENNKWKAVRPWLTGWLDAKSLYFTGVHIGVDNPSSTQILAALQNGIRLNNNTPPKILYNDNGKDYLKQGFTEDFIPKDTDYKHKIINELGIKTVNSLPYRGRSKTIERMFKEVCSGFSKIWGAYLGNKPNARPEVASFYWDNPEELPSLHEFCEEFARWLQEDYHSKKSDGIIMQGKSPDEVWSRGSGGNQLSDRDLYYSLLLPFVSNCPKVARGSAIVLNGKEYRSNELMAFFGQKIMVKQDMINGGAPHAYTLDGRHICVLEPIVPIPALASTDEDRAMISAELRQQRLELKRAFTIADEMSGGMRKVAPQELMRLKPGVDFELIKITSKSKSVKGNNHNFSMLKVKEEKPEERELTRGEEKAKQLAAFEEAIKEENAEPEISQEAIAEFHQHTMSSENRREHNYEGSEW